MDSLAANVFTIPLSNIPVTLTTPPNSGSAWAGPYSAQSAVIRFTGVLTADVTVTLPRSGFFIVQNKCTVGAFVVILASSAPGNVICAPPGESIHVFSDGVDMEYVALGRINAYEDFAGSTVPRWITACTIPPYLNCNGATFSGTTYPNTAAYLGGTTLPDARGRTRFALNQTTGRITLAAGFGIDGNTLAAAGGSQTLTQDSLPAVSPTFTGSSSTFNSNQGDILRNPSGFQSAGFAGNSGFGLATGYFGGFTIQVTGIPNGNISALGSGDNFLPPGFVGGLTLIRAG